MKTVIGGFLLLILSASVLSAQVVCVKKGYLLASNGKTIAKQIPSSDKPELLRFDFSQLRLFRIFKGNEVQRKLAKIRDNFYKEDFYLGVIVYQFNDEKTQLVSTEQAYRQVLLTHWYSCHDFFENNGI